MLKHAVRGLLVTIALTCACLASVLLPTPAHAATSAAVDIAQDFGAANALATSKLPLTYTLVPDVPSNPMPAQPQVSLSGKDSATIGPITPTSSGTYSYTLTLDASNAPRDAYTFDTHVYKVVLYAADLSDVKLIVFSDTGAKTEVATFKHTYAPAATNPKLMVDPPVIKIITGSPKTASKFTFALRATEAGYPMPQGSKGNTKQITITGAGQGEFGTWSYTKPGIYFYTVSEVDEGISGYTYDKSIYTITDKVVDAGGKLELERTLTNTAGKRVSACRFTNTYASSILPPKVASTLGPKTSDTSLPTALGALALTSAITALIAVLSRKKQAEEH